MAESILSYPRVCGLLGKFPSRLSQAMHNAAFQAQALPFVYAAFHTEDTAFGLQAMRDLGLRGLSLTIPHKEVAMELVDELAPEARSIGAINTVVNDAGTLRGSNTDWIGIKEALSEANYKVDQRAVLLFGAGGASRAALFTLQRLGVEKILITNRTLSRAEKLAEEFSAEVLPYEELKSFDFSSLSLFINSSAIGSPSAPKDAAYPFELGVFEKSQTVFDMVTKETDLLRAAAKSGATTIPGVRMLLHQAVPQFLAFTELQKAPVSVMEEALLKELAES